MASISLNLFDILDTSKKNASEILEDLNQEEVKKLFSFEIDRDRAFKKLYPLMISYVRLYANKINQINENKRDFNFYYFLLLPYFSYIISVTYSKFLFISEKSESFQEMELTYPYVQVRKKRVCKKSIDFFANVYLNPEFHEWLTSLICKEIGVSIRGEKVLESFKLQEQNISFFQILKNREVYKKPHRLYYIIMEILHKKTKNNFLFKNIYGFGLLTNTFFSLILYIKRYIPRRTRNPELQNYLLKGLEDKYNLEPAFIKVIHKVIEQTFPESLLEDFDVNVKHAKTCQFKKNFPFYFSSLSYQFDQKNLKHALLREKNTKIVLAQHGGGYTTFLPYITFCGEYIVDYFILWGSIKPTFGSCQFLTIPSPLLSKLKNKHKIKNNNMIFVGTSVNPLWDGILYPNSVYFRDYILEKKIFFDTISLEVFKNTFYKLHPNVSYERFNEQKFMTELLPELKKISSSITINKKLLQCKLLVMDSYSTTFYKAMAANTPVIIYFGLPTFKLLPEAKELFDEFKKLNIVFDTASEAANFINANWNNIDRWWLSSDVQAARKKFCDRYAQADRWYYFKWIKALIKL